MAPSPRSRHRSCNRQYDSWSVARVSVAVSWSAAPARQTVAWGSRVGLRKAPPPLSRSPSPPQHPLAAPHDRKPGGRRQQADCCTASCRDFAKCPTPATPAVPVIPTLTVMAGPRPGHPPHQVPPRAPTHSQPHLSESPAADASKQTVAWGRVGLSRRAPTPPLPHLPPFPHSPSWPGLDPAAIHPCRCRDARHPQHPRAAPPERKLGGRRQQADCCLGSCRTFAKSPTPPFPPALPFPRSRSWRGPDPAIRPHPRRPQRPLAARPARKLGRTLRRTDCCIGLCQDFPIRAVRPHPARHPRHRSPLLSVARRPCGTRSDGYRHDLPSTALTLGALRAPEPERNATPAIRTKSAGRRRRANRRLRAGPRTHDIEHPTRPLV